MFYLIFDLLVLGQCDPLILAVWLQLTPRAFGYNKEEELVVPLGTPHYKYNYWALRIIAVVTF